jgi:transposase-like protein
MSQIKKNYNPNFKLKVVLKYLANDCTVSELCQEFSISKAAVHKWVSQLKSSADSVFNGKSKDSSKKEYDKRIELLNSQIGQLFVENNFLKKVLDV